MLRSLLPPIAFFAISSGCSGLPDSYPPPVQHAALAAVPADIPFGPMFAIGDPNAFAHIVRGVAAEGPPTWRWTDAHPVFRFYLPDASHLFFLMDFTLPPVTFRDTGPVTLTFRLNDQILDRARFETPGQLHFRKQVPDAMLRRNAVNLVAVDADPAWVSKEDHSTLGFILVRAGFAE